MADPVWSDGFDLYAGTATGIGTQSKWTHTGGGTYSLVAGRFGGQAYRLSPTAGSSCQPNRAIGQNLSTFTYKTAFRTTVPTFAMTGLIVFEEAGVAAHCGLSLTATGALTACRFTNRSTIAQVLQTSANNVILNSTWQYIEVDVVIHDSAGSIVVRVDGTEVINISGVDTRTGGTGVFNHIAHFFTSGTGKTYDFDDCIVYNGHHTGERKITTIRPAADTADADFTPSTGSDHYAMVDDTTVVTTDYVQASTVGDLDLYEMGDLVETPVEIDGVNFIMFGLKTDATTRNIAGVLDLLGVQDQTANFALTATSAKHEELFALDPNGVAWDAAAVNGILAGPKVTV